MTSTKVPKAFGETYAAITATTDDVCQAHLNEEYGELARFASAALCRKRPSLLSKGKPQTWACGILYALGRVNFLSDKSHEPSMALGELCDLMATGKSTASAKQGSYPKRWSSTSFTRTGGCPACWSTTPSLGSLRSTG